MSLKDDVSSLVQNHHVECERPDSHQVGDRAAQAIRKFYPAGHLVVEKRRATVDSLEYLCQTHGQECQTFELYWESTSILGVVVHRILPVSAVPC